MAKFIPRTKQQNSVLHKLLGDFSFTADDKAEMVFDITGGRTEHSSEMSVDECNRMIVRLGGKAISNSRRSQQLDRQIAGVKQIATAKHRNLMEMKARNRGISKDGLGDLSAKVNKGVRIPRTSEEVNHVIEALKAMDKRDKTFGAFKKPEAA